MSISVTNSLTLRNFYHSNRDYATKSKRTGVTKSALSHADATALRRAVRQLGSYNYEDCSKEDLSEKLKAFIDTYNNTIDSTGKGVDQNAYAAGRQMKNLTKQYQNELDNLGISIDGRGYLSISNTAVTNINSSSFEEMFGKNSKYMSSLGSYAKRITNHINTFA